MGQAPKPENDFFNLKNKVPKTRSDFFNLKNKVPRTGSDFFNLKNKVPKTGSDFFNLKNKVPRTGSDFFNLKNKVPKTRSGFFNLKNKVPKTRSDFFNLKNKVPRTGSDFFNLKNKVPRTGSDFFNLKNKVPRTGSDFFNLKNKVPRTGSGFFNLKWRFRENQSTKNQPTKQLTIMTIKFFITISLNMMKNFLHFDLMQKVNNCLVNDQALGNQFQPFQTAFSTAFTRLDDAMQISRKSLLTPEIQKLDAQRVQEWRIIRAAIRESLRLPDAASAEAADFVMSLVNNHGDVPAMKVTERTGALTNLCQDLTVKYAAQVAAIGLTGFAEQLSATNAEYLSLYEQRLHEWSEYTDGEVVAAREAIDDALENLLIMVASGILTQGMTPFKHFVDYVNEAIKVAKIAMGSPTTKPDGSGQEEENTPGGGSGETTNPNEPSNPGGGAGGGGSNTGGGGSENTGGGGSNTGGGGSENTVTVVFEFHGGRAETVTGVPGTAMTKPANTEGYMWPATVPATFPSENATYTEVEDNRQEYQITYMDANNEDEFDIQMVKEGDPITPPTPPTGYHWVDVPEVMPARNIYIRCAANA